MNGNLFVEKYVLYFVTLLNNTRIQSNTLSFLQYIYASMVIREILNLILAHFFLKYN